MRDPPHGGPAAIVEPHLKHALHVHHTLIWLGLHTCGPEASLTSGLAASGGEPPVGRRFPRPPSTTQEIEQATHIPFEHVRHHRQQRLNRHFLVGADHEITRALEGDGRPVGILQQGHTGPPLILVLSERRKPIDQRWRGER